MATPLSIQLYTLRDEVQEDFAAVRSDLILAAHLLSDDPTRVLPPPRPSKAPDPSPVLPGDNGHGLFKRKAPRKDPKSPPRSPRSPTKGG